MAASIPFAKLIGPILLVAALAMLANPKDLREIAREFLKSRALIYVTGVLAMLGGLAIVNNHNVWVANWPVIITLLGWALVIGGAFRIALPSAVQSIGGAMLERPAVIRIAGAVWVLIGALLTYKGYFPAR
jgi:hypothetical protein